MGSGVLAPRVARAPRRGTARTLPDRLPPKLQLIPLGVVHRGQPVTIDVSASDPSGVARVTVFWVAAANADATSIPLVTANGRLFRGALPAGATAAETLTFWIEGADQHGNVARLGGPGVATLSILVLPPEPAPLDGPTVVETPSYETWWFWTATLGGAALLTGAGVLTWALLDDDADGAPSAPREFGDVRVEVGWPR